MFTRIPSTNLNIFESHSRIAFLGASGSGKSVLFRKLAIKYAHVFDEIIVIGGDIVEISGIPHLRRDDDFDILNKDTEKKSLFLIDDSLYSPKLLKKVAEAFTRIRHKNASIALCSQNLFHNSSEYRSILHNTTHVFLLRTRNIGQIKLFAKSFLADSQIENFLEVYRKTVLKTRYGYILIDFLKDFDSPLVIRTHLFGEQPFEIAFSV